jgi:signal transduction histidine kinase
LYFFASQCQAQLIPVSPVIDIATVRDTENIAEKALLFIDSSQRLEPGAASGRIFFPLTDFEGRRSIPAGMIKYAYFLKFTIQNSGDSEKTVFLYPGIHYNKVNLYKLKEYPEMLSEAPEMAGYGKITMAAHEQATILVYLKPTKTENTYIKPRIINRDFVENFKFYLMNSRSSIITFGYIMSGVLLMMFLFMVANFVLSKKIEFLYNALYSFCMFLLIFLNSFTLGSTSLFSNSFKNYWDFFLLVMGTIFYIAFTRKFLDTGRKYILLDEVLKYSSYSIIFLFALYSYTNFFLDQYPFQLILENVIKFSSLVFGVFFIILAIQQRNRLLNYLAAGNAVLVLGSAISLGILWSKIKSVDLLTSSLFYYYLGIAAELSFFLLGLTYKNRNELISRIKEQEAMKLYAEKKEFETQIAIMKAQQEERNRISADMHDDLGAGMTTIRLYSELAKTKLGQNSIPEIEKISSSSDELLDKMNAIIWSMSSSNDTLGNMIAYIRSYALEYFEDTGIQCNINIPENLPNIEVIGEIRRNVFLVVKEVLNNILKHAKATEVKITLEKVGDGLTLYIHDNGVGINFDSLRQFSNGLKNMRKRMADINIEFSIENKNGTLVTLHRKVNQFNPSSA